jgi:putative DNA primase/helicase
MAKSEPVKTLEEVVEVEEEEEDTGEVLTVQDDSIVKDERIGKRRVKLDKLAEYIMAKYTFKTIRNSSRDGNDEILVYDAVCGVYREKGESIIREAIEEILTEYGMAEQATKYNVSEVIGHIRRRTYIDRTELNRNRNLVNVQNGLLNLTKVLRGEPDPLETHTSQNLYTIQFPVKYDPKATCPRISKFLHEVVAEEDVPLIEEIFGWCLILDYRFQKGILFVGEGWNGKSTLLNLIKEFLGSENCSAQSLQAVCSDRFALAELYGKLANVCADLSRATISDVGKFKQLTGGDTVPAQRKFGAPFTFVSFAKLLFSANTPPPIYDDTVAMWRRIMIINFPNQFLGDKDVKGLIYKLTTQSELSGLLNLALAGLRRLMQQQDFSYSRSLDETREDYVKRSNPLQAFVEECCILGMEDATVDGTHVFMNEPPAIPKEELYQHYLAYCRGNKLTPEGKKSFGRHLKALCKRDIRERKAGWVGISIKEEAE